jgi:hypothetical protein
VNESVARLIAFCQENGRVCPMPLKWVELHQRLPNRRHLGAGAWEPANPLILAGWSAPDEAKRERLREHIEWAHHFGALEPIAAFLRGLKDDDWYYAG